MQSLSKKTISFIATTMFVVACNNQVENSLVKNDDKFSTKALFPTPEKSTVLSKAEMDAILTFKPPVNTIGVQNQPIISSKIEDEKEITFDNPNIDEIGDNATSITVIYHNKYKMRVRRGHKKILSSTDSFEMNKTSSVLEKYGVLNSTNQSEFMNIAENKSDEDEIRMEKTFKKTQVPNRQSIHLYDFPKGTDFK